MYENSWKRCVCVFNVMSAGTEEIRSIPGNQTTLDLRDLTVGVSYVVTVTALVGTNEGDPVTVSIKPGGRSSDYVLLSSCLHHHNETRNPHVISNIINPWLLVVFNCFHAQSVWSFLSCDSEFLSSVISTPLDLFNQWRFPQAQILVNFKFLWILNSCEFYGRHQGFDSCWK